MRSVPFFESVVRGLDDPNIRCSYHNYHVTGLDYLCLRRYEGLTIKVYDLDPDKMVAYPEGWLAAPHSHAYNFDTYVLSGSIRNLLFRSESGEGRWRHRYTVRSGGGGTLADPTECRLEELSGQTYGPQDSYKMTPDEIHTLVTSEPTILLLYQWRTTRRTTDVWLPEPRTALGTASDTYLSMDRDRAVRIADKVRKILSKA